MTRKGPRRLEIERRLALFHANRPRVIARELGVSTAWVNDVSLMMRAARVRAQRGEKRPSQIDVGKEFGGKGTEHSRIGKRTTDAC
jgi:hypothetical protein